MEYTLTAASENTTLKVSSWNGVYEHVAVECDPTFTDENVMTALTQWASVGCPVAKLALALLCGDTYDMLARQPGYVHGPVRLYRDGARW